MRMMTIDPFQTQCRDLLMGESEVISVTDAGVPVALVRVLGRAPTVPASPHEDGEHEPVRGRNADLFGILAGRVFIAQSDNLFSTGAWERDR